SAAPERNRASCLPPTLPVATPQPLPLPVVPSAASTTPAPGTTELKRADVRSRLRTATYCPVGSAVVRQFFVCTRPQAERPAKTTEPSGAWPRVSIQTLLGLPVGKKASQV